MSRRARLALAVEVEAPVEAVWAAVTDWPGQSRWMLGTRVRATTMGAEGAPGRGVGGGIEARTGLGRSRRLGVLDTMVITHWDPPRRCAVRHTGRVIRGAGYFAFVPVPGPTPKTRFVWAEEVLLPFGPLGVLGWAVLRPLLAAGVRTSLRGLARELG